MKEQTEKSSVLQGKGLNLWGFGPDSLAGTIDRGGGGKLLFETNEGAETQSFFP